GLIEIHGRRIRVMNEKSLIKIANISD
ncbi:MAG: hypothetical protein H6R34_303, partial [Bacteroidetes bacterium]|nr:hypothetical protein [Bacteroidota bacterium]